MLQTSSNNPYPLYALESGPPFAPTPKPNKTKQNQTNFTIQSLAIKASNTNGSFYNHCSQFITFNVSFSITRDPSVTALAYDPTP